MQRYDVFGSHMGPGSKYTNMWRFNQSETEAIAGVKGDAANKLLATLAAAYPGILNAVSLYAFGIRLKAKWCVRHDKCLEISQTSVLIVPASYDVGAPWPNGFY